MESSSKFVYIPVNTDTPYYFDYAATMPMLPQVREAMCRVFAEQLGNASSLHSGGQQAKNLLEEARAQVARLINADPAEIIFTSGGTEANNTVMHIFDQQNIAISAVEHPSVTKSAEYYAKNLTQIPVDNVGRIKVEDVPLTADLVSIMLANNEVGTVEPVAELSQYIKKSTKNNPKSHVKFTTSNVENHQTNVVKNTIQQSKNTKKSVVKNTTITTKNASKNVVKNTTDTKVPFLHTDATQALGKLPIDVRALGVDYLTISAHKIGGPVGVGALYVRRGAPFRPLLLGGHQESGRRAGTANVATAVGFGVAAEQVYATQSWRNYNTTIRKLRDELRARLLAAIPQVVVNTPSTGSLPHILNLSFPAAEGEAVQLYLDLAGVMVSTGSACASGDLAPSPVMMALRHDAELAHGSVRFSLGPETTPEAIDYLAQVVPEIVRKLQGISTISAG